jgi:hypothetical protein
MNNPDAIPVPSYVRIRRCPCGKALPTRCQTPDCGGSLFHDRNDDSHACLLCARPFEKSHPWPCVSPRLLTPWRSGRRGRAVYSMAGA